MLSFLLLAMLALLSFKPAASFSNVKQRPFYESETVKVINFSAAEAMEYLSQVNLIDKEKADHLRIREEINVSEISSEITKLQKSMSIPETGQLDEETIRLMQMPICGNTEIDGEVRQQMKDKRRVKRYTLGWGRWRKKHLKYFIQKYTPDTSPSVVDIVMQRTVELWANHTNLKISETLKRWEADFRIAFVTGPHGDGAPFGPGTGGIAHAWYPFGSNKGKVHFNDWVEFGADGTYLYLVAVHEFGHSLGLAHCDITGAAMCHGSEGWDTSGDLHADDIAGIQLLYGKKRRRKNKIASTPSVQICQPGFAFDALHFLPRSEAIWGFKGEYVWKMNDFGLLKGYPRKANTLWKKIPANFTASFFSKTTNKTYFFRGIFVWRYTTGKLDKGFPKRTAFYNIPANIQAAVQVGKGVPYVIRGPYMWKFYENPIGIVPNRTRISYVWPRAPRNIDAAIQWRDGNVYFFKKNKYWGLSNLKRRAGLRKFEGWKNFRGLVKPSLGTFPKSVRDYWLGCGTSPAFKHTFDLFPLERSSA